MAGVASGQVHKIIRVVATSESSWEDAARVAVAEAVKTIKDLQTATVVEADTVVRDGRIVRYRVKLEMAFQLDRSRLIDDGATAVQVRRYLILANQTLPSPGLRELIDEKASAGPSEFHVLVPEAPKAALYSDPTGTFDPSFATIADVGSAQEVPGITGLAHMFEHMAFKGTPNIGTKDYKAEKIALERLEEAYQAYQSMRLSSRTDPEVLRRLEADFREKQEQAAGYVVTNEFDPQCLQQTLDAFTA